MVIANSPELEREYSVERSGHASLARVKSEWRNRMFDMVRLDASQWIRFHSRSTEMNEMKRDS